MSLLTRMKNQVMYRTVYKQECNDMPKLIEVVMSCDTPEQIDAARAYHRIFAQNYCQSDDAFGAVGRKLLEQLEKFMCDTKHHIENGWHRPDSDEGETINKYPDMNDYLGDILQVRFRTHWIKGKRSVIDHI